MVVSWVGGCKARANLNGGEQNDLRLLSPVSRTQWLLCADPPFFLCTIKDAISGMDLSSLTPSSAEDLYSLICLF